MRGAGVWRRVCGVAAAVVACVGGGAAWAQGPVTTAFTYQGRLDVSGVPANGAYDMVFRLHPSPGLSAPLGPTLCVDNVAVVDGVFSVSLDFGAGALYGDLSRRYLDVSVRADTGLGCGDTTGLVTLVPRQELVATPFAVGAISALRATTADNLGSTLPIARGGTNLTAVGPSGTYMRSNGTTMGFTPIAGADLPGMSGDLSGPYTLTNVVGLRGRPLANVTPINGQVLTFNGSSWTPITPAAPPDLLGDVTGPLLSTTVARLRGRAVSATPPTVGQVLLFDGSQWAPGAVPAATVSGGAGGTIVDGTITSADLASDRTMLLDVSGGAMNAPDATRVHIGTGSANLFAGLTVGTDPTPGVGPVGTGLIVGSEAGFSQVWLKSGTTRTLQIQASPSPTASIDAVGYDRLTLGAGPAPAEIEVLASGQVGIGTANPSAGLHLVSAVLPQLIVADNNATNPVTRIWMLDGAATGDGVVFENNGVGDSMSISAKSGAAVSPIITCDLRPVRRVGILRDAVSNALEVQGDASKTTAGSWLANSDRRIKQGITTVTDGLTLIERVRPVRFQYDPAYAALHGIDPRRVYFNVIAQEFATVFPSAVKGSGEYMPGMQGVPQGEIMQVDTYPATIASIAAIQELSRSVRSLQTRADSAEQSLKDRTREVADLRQLVQEQGRQIEESRRHAAEAARQAERAQRELAASIRQLEERLRAMERQR